jgi:hypothetical protein
LGCPLLMQYFHLYRTCSTPNMFTSTWGYHLSRSPQKLSGVSRSSSSALVRLGNWAGTRTDLDSRFLAVDSKLFHLWWGRGSSLAFKK